MPSELRPIVQVVPDWFRPQRLGLVFEARVGKGKLLVSSINLSDDLQKRPAARQLRLSLLQYAESDSFQPATTVSADAIRGLFRRETVVQQLGAQIEADSAHRSHPATNAIDGDPKTIWHTDWEPSPAPMPHWLILDLGEPHLISGIRYVPRQDMTNGRIAEYTIHVSDDGEDWGSALKSGTVSRGTTPLTVQFSKACSGRYIRLTANREVDGKPFAAVAEVDVLLSDIETP